MDTTCGWLILAAVALGFVLALLPKAIDAIKAYTAMRHRELDADVARMRNALNTLEYWMGEQAVNAERLHVPVRPGAWRMWRAYVRDVLGMPKLEEPPPSGEQTKGAGQ